MAYKDLEILINAKDQASATIKKVQKEVKNIGPTANKATKEVKKLSSSFSGLGSALTGLISIGAITTFGKNLLKLGSDLEEITSKFNVVFSGIEEEAKMTFDTMANAVGRSKLELMEFSSNLGDVLKPLGFTTEEAFLLSENMTKLAIDVASFNNVTDAQAINAFRSALTGEREALKTLGIVINEADLKTEAYTSGIAKQGTALTKQQKALATYNLLLENTSDAQGDAVRTSKSFANQWKRLTGTIKDSFAEAGKDIAEQTSGLLEDIANFMAVYGKLILRTVGEIGKTIGLIVLEALSGIATIFVGAMNIINKATSDTNEQTLTLGQAFIKAGQIFNIGLKSIKLAIQTLGKWIGGLAVGVVLSFDKIINVIGKSFKVFGAGIAGGFIDIINSIGKFISNLVNNVIGGINAVIIQVNKLGLGLDTLDEVDISIKTKLDATSIMNDVSTIKSDISDIGNVFGGVFDDVNDSVIDEVNNISDYYAKTQNDIISTTKDTNGKIEGSYSTLFDSIKDLADKYKDGAGDLGKGTAEQLKALSKEAKNSITPITKAFEKSKTAIKKTEDSITKLLEKFNEFKTEGSRAILKVNKELKELHKNSGKIMIGIETGKTEDLSSRFVDIKDRLAELKEEQKEDFTVENYNEIKELKAEQLLIEQNVTAEVLAQAVAYEKTSDAFKIISDAEKAKYEEVQKFKAEEARLIEKKKILEIQATQNGVNDLKLRTVEKDGILTAFYEDEKGKMIEIKDYENVLEAEKILAKQLQMQEETIALVNQLETQKIAQATHLKTLKGLWTTYHTNLETETKDTVTSMMSEYAKIVAQLKRIIALKAQAGMVSSGSVSGAKASGGTVASNRTYLVGERGPELFTAPGAGNITPNNQLGGGTTQININVTGNNISNEADEMRLAERIKESLARDISLAKNFGIA